MSRLVFRLLRDEYGGIPLQYFVAVVALALLVVAASRPIAVALASLLYRFHILTALAMR